MDRNSPEFYVQSTATNLKEAEEAIRYVQSLGTPLLRPVITPRFVPTCTPELLQGGATCRSALTSAFCSLHGQRLLPGSNVLKEMEPQSLYICVAWAQLTRPCWHYQQHIT